MTGCEVARHLLEYCTTLREFNSFMFGSSVSGVGNDFDILVVGPSGKLLSRLKKELQRAGEQLPLDVLYMLPEEAEETGFIEKTGCISLAQLAGFDKIGFYNVGGCQLYGK